MLRSAFRRARFTEEEPLDAEWLDGAFSAGDLMMVSVLLRLRVSGLLDEYPSLAAYVARGEARPALSASPQGRTSPPS
jgi:glutathione S-transferase